MRLLVHVEGQTEETFVKDVLAPHLHRRGYASVAARLVGSHVAWRTFGAPISTIG